ncbi:MAG: CHAP domain-containing protein [Blastomonas sp.]
MPVTTAALAQDSDGIQCVPYVREVTGVRIFGDAHSWWDQAEGRYDRGTLPRPGAVMAFRPYGSMSLGHVAAVSRIVDSRTVLLDHANWSPINGRRGQIERNVMAVDVSPNNDWSRVRVWYDPIQGLGTTEYPLAGFIYPAAPAQKPPRMQYASARVTESVRTPVNAQPVQSDTAAPDPIGDLLEQLGQ